VCTPTLLLFYSSTLFKKPGYLFLPPTLPSPLSVSPTPGPVDGGCRHPEGQTGEA